MLGNARAGQVGPSLQKDLPLFFSVLVPFLYLDAPTHPLSSASGQKLPFWLLAGRSLLARNVHILLGPYSKHTSSLAGRKAGGLGGLPLIQ